MSNFVTVADGATLNGAGTLEREYAIGSGRMDLCLRYAGLTLGMELKVWRDGYPGPLTAGLAQLGPYLAGLGLDTGWLVIFDRRPRRPWSRRIFWRTVKSGTRTIHVVGA